jgi:long-subunit fatty acid transport protein
MGTEVEGCDALTRVQVRSFKNFAMQFGLLLHPVAGLHIGAHVKSAVNLGLSPIEATGTVSASEPPYLPLSAALGDAASTGRMDALFITRLPWIIRGGVRYGWKKNGREIFDVELDATYEMWGQANGSDNELTLLNPPQLVNQGNPVTIRLVHNYRDTFSIRFAGSFSQPIGPEALITARLGVMYDSSATRSADTRIDFDSLEKIGGAGGVGFTVRGLTLNVSYAYLHSMPRTVTDGALLPIDGQTGKPLSVNGQPAAPINNGDYRGNNHILSIGVSFLFDEIARGRGWMARRGLEE